MRVIPIFSLFMCISLSLLFTMESNQLTCSEQVESDNDCNNSQKHDSLKNKIIKFVRNKISSERFKTNLTDAALFSLIALIIDQLIFESHSFLLSIGCGIAGWGVGELSETIYKEIFKKINGSNLREFLGKIEFFGLEVDNQRLFRRAISVILVAIFLSKISLN